MSERLQATGSRGHQPVARQHPPRLARARAVPRMVDDGVVGVTSNPTIFQKAIADSDDYDEAIAAATAPGKDARQTCSSSWPSPDVQEAADQLRGVYDDTGHLDGFVSFELPPAMANDTAASITAAPEFCARIDRPNIFIKIPGTAEGVPAIEESIAAGVNVNVTLLFSLDAYEAIHGPSSAGWSGGSQQGQPIDDVHSVASFFVSRVDTAVDKQLPEGSPLRGRAAIANAKLAYQDFLGITGGRSLAGAGRPRRARAAAAVGVHRHQEPGLLRRALRGRPDRAGLREHDARRRPSRRSPTTAWSSARSTGTWTAPAGELEQAGGGRHRSRRRHPPAGAGRREGRSRSRSTRSWGRCGSGSTGSVPAARRERPPTCDTKEGDMELAMIGLGRMGGNMAHRLTDAGHTVVGWTRSGDESLAKQYGISWAGTLEDAVAALKQRPRVVWLMIPAGAPTSATVTQLTGLLEAGDIVVDGGNSNFRDSQQHAATLAEHGIEFIDCGTSGGVWGYANGYCLMIGGSDAAVATLAPAFETLAPPDGWLHTGPVGSGHFTKMVHNGIEYGLMQAYGEGFEILEKSEFDLDLPAIAEVWRHSSVIQSWLLDLLARALAEDPKLEHIKGYVDDSGEGRWTVMEAINESVAAPAIAIALMARFTSRDPDPFAMKAIAALRNQFGGHAVVRE